MAGRRSALIVATYEYGDTGLARLRAPEHDAEALAGVLGDPAVGDFEVQTVVNQPAHEVNRAVAAFFRDGRPDDLFLLHFSCHGVKDDSGELYFAAPDTSLDLLEATSVSSSFVNQVMHRSRAGTVLLLLDCCYSGAFGRGYVPRAGNAVDVGDRLGGSGRAVITASSALEYAFEGSDLADGNPDTRPSVFTSALVKGLATGEADRDLDGWVSLDELYGYIYDEVTSANPHQTPERRFEVQGDLMVARRSQPVTTASDLPDELSRSLSELLPWVRGSAVAPLTVLLRGPHPGRALAARQALQRMADGDDSFENRSAARTALAGAPVDPDATAVMPFPELVPMPPATPTQPSTQPSTRPSAPAPAEAEPEEEPAVLSSEPVAPPPRGPGARLVGWVDGHRRAALAAAAVTALLVAGLAVWQWPEGRSDDTGTSSLSSDTMLVALTDTTRASRLVSVNTDEVSTKPVGVGGLAAGYPSVSPDRTEMTFLVPNDDGDMTPYLARTDGSHVRRLISASDREGCPYARRPAWSPDGEQLAVACQAAGKKDLGLFTFDAQGHLLEELDSDRTYVGAPTWAEDDRVYFPVQQGPGGERPSEIWRVPDDGQDGAKVWRAVADRWLNHPDASTNGIVYLSNASAADQESDTRIMVGRLDGRDDGGRDTRLDLDLTGATWPTWSSDGTALAWVQQDHLRWVDLDRPRDVHDVDGLPGTPGPPAWGSR